MADVRREGQLFTLCLLAIHVTVNIISKEWQYLKGYNDVGIIYIDLTAYGHPKETVIVFWCLFADFLLFLPLACSTGWHRKKRYPYWKRPFQVSRHFSYFCILCRRTYKVFKSVLTFAKICLKKPLKLNKRLISNPNGIIYSLYCPMFRKKPNISLIESIEDVAYSSCWLEIEWPWSFQGHIWPIRLNYDTEHIRSHILVWIT